MLVSNTNSAVNDVNGVGDIIHMMNVQDYADSTNQEINDERDYQRISKMYIKDETRDGYHGCNKRLLLWLYSNNPELVEDYAKEQLRTQWTQRD